jgi:leader peptidase (prepilin peptidase) / N-methyltransferase
MKNGHQVQLVPVTRSLLGCAAVGVIFVTLLLVERLGMTAALPAYLYFVIVGMLLAVIDAATAKLPDRLTLPSYAVLVVLLGVAEAVSPNQGSTTRAVEAAVLFVAVFFTSALLRGVGLGDVKLAGLLGLVLGFRSWTTVYAGMLVAFVLAAIFIVFSSIRGRNCVRIPLGPFLVAGAIVAILL